MIGAMVDGLSESMLQQLAGDAARGDQQAWRQLLEALRPRLRKMIALRIDRRVQGRVDPSDVIQEACIDAARRLQDYIANPTMPFFLWLRLLAGQRLVEQHRRHLGAKARDVGREVQTYHGSFPETTITVLAEQLLSEQPGPSSEAIQAEQSSRLHAALAALDPIDREILALRHFEQLTNAEAAAALGLDTSTASKRYTRALVRLKHVLQWRLETSRD
jgi:RNA polymerase sigma-70 factor, ECF subfamily